jgi:hypothetical protein
MVDTLKEELDGGLNFWFPGQKWTLLGGHRTRDFDKAILESHRVQRAGGRTRTQDEIAVQQTIMKRFTEGLNELAHKSSVPAAHWVGLITAAPTIALVLASLPALLMLKGDADRVVRFFKTPFRWMERKYKQAQAHKLEEARDQLARDLKQAKQPKLEEATTGPEDPQKKKQKLFSFS